MRTTRLASVAIALALSVFVESRAQGPPLTPVAIGPTAQAAGYASPAGATTPLYASPVATYGATAVATIPPTRLGALVGRIGGYLTQFGQPRVAALPSVMSVQATIAPAAPQVQAQAAAPLYLMVPTSGSGLMPQPAMAWGGMLPTSQR